MRYWDTKRTIQEEWDDLERRALAYESAHGKPVKSDWRKPAALPSWYSWWVSWSNGTSGDATPDKPYRIHVAGNDDTSYAKVYASEHEAREELSLMLACEPLDFHRDFISLGGWVFTN